MPVNVRLQKAGNTRSVLPRTYFLELARSLTCSSVYREMGKRYMQHFTVNLLPVTPIDLNETKPPRKESLALRQCYNYFLFFVWDTWRVSHPNNSAGSRKPFVTTRLYIWVQCCSCSFVVASLATWCHSSVWRRNLQAVQ